MLHAKYHVVMQRWKLIIPNPKNMVGWVRRRGNASVQLMMK